MSKRTGKRKSMDKDKGHGQWPGTTMDNAQEHQIGPNYSSIAYQDQKEPKASLVWESLKTKIYVYVYVYIYIYIYIYM